MEECLKTSPYAWTEEIIKKEELKNLKISAKVEYVSPQYNGVTYCKTSTKEYYIHFKDRVAGPFSYIKLRQEGYVEAVVGGNVAPQENDYVDECDKPCESINQDKQEIYIDILGRITPQLLKSSKDAYEYYKGYRSLSSLNEEYFLEEGFIDGIIDISRIKFEKELNDRYGKKMEINPLEFSRASLTMQIISKKCEIATKRNDTEKKVLQESVKFLDKQNENIEQNISSINEENNRREEIERKAKETIKADNEAQILGVFRS